MRIRTPRRRHPPPARMGAPSATPTFLLLAAALLLLCCAFGPRPASAACAVGAPCRDELLAGTCAAPDAAAYTWLWANGTYALAGELHKGEGGTMNGLGGARSALQRQG